jgi:ligand-binding sensor domain-containing protein
MVTRLAATLMVLLAAGASAHAQALADMHVVKPVSTGIPGEELRVMKFDPQGNLWVAGRAPFWFDSGAARLPAAQVPHEALPGGGFDTGAWDVWSSVHYPIPSAFISGIEFGANGVVWIASGAIDQGGGLTRFQPDAADPASTFFTYDSSNSPLLLDNIYSLDMDATGRLWMVNGHVNNRPAVFSLDPATGEWQQFDMGEELPWPSGFKLVGSVHAGLSGHIYVTHGSLGGLAEYDGTTWTLNPGAQFDSILEDMAGNVWLTTGGNGLFKWNGSTLQHWPTLGGTVTITGLDMDPDTGLVYVGTWYGPIYRMINGTTPQLFVDADALPYHIEIRPEGDVWIGNYGGNGVSGTARHYTAGGALLERINTWNCGLPDYFVDDILADTTGNLWFATGEAGITRMQGSDGAPDSSTHWRNWGDHNDAAEPYPWAGNEPMECMFDAGDGTIWMGGNGVGRWVVATGQFIGFWNWQNSSLGVDEVNDIDRDANGDIWIGTGGSGAFRYDPVADDWVQHAFSDPYSYSQERIFTIARDHDGVLWFGAEYGLHTFDGTTWTALHLHGGLPFDAFGVRDIEVGPDGDVWVCTQAGLARRNGASWDFHTPANSGLLGEWVRSVTIRDDGLVGVASFNFFPNVGGVNTFDGTKWVGYTTANSPLTHFQCEAVQFDADGDLWASAMSEGVVEILVGGTRGAWTLLGDGLPGAGGLVPELVGSGTLEAGSSNTLTLSDARPSAPAWLVVGLQAVNLPLKGGVLVPDPLLALSLQTSPAGGLALAFHFPAGVPSGTELVLQAWVQDAAGIEGFAASNGLAGLTP